MKTISALALLALLAITTAPAQNVFVLGSNTTPPPDLNGNIPQPVQPVATAAVAPAAAATVNVNVNVNTTATPAYATPSYSSYPSYVSYPAPYPQYYSPNVIYVGGPGTCGPNYSHYPYYNNNVIYFGGLQAYRHGYHFRHCR